MGYRNQDYDIVARTRKIIEQYEKLGPDERYEVTLLLNCLLGLLIIPKERYLEEIPDNINLLTNWGIRDEFIEKPTRKITNKDFIRHLRNAVAHYHIRVCGEGQNIKNIWFWDSGFKVNIPVSNLKKFVVSLSDYYFEIVKRGKEADEPCRA